MLAKARARSLCSKIGEICPFLEFSTNITSFSNYPLVFLHGILGSKQNWRTISSKLSRDHGFKCYSLDSRHHGDWRCSGRFDYFKMATDIKKFLDQQNIPKINLVGHSMGGKTAMTFSQVYPNMLSTLSVIDIAPIKVRQYALINGYLHTMFSIELLGKSKAEVLNVLEQKLQNPDLCRFLIMNLKQNEKGELYWVPEKNAFIESFKEIASFPEFRPNYNGPALFVVGQKSEYVNPSDYPSINALYPQARIEEIKNAGHMIHMEAPEQLISVLTDFILKDNTSNKNISSLEAR